MKRKKTSKLRIQAKQINEILGLSTRVQAQDTRITFFS